MEIIDAFLHPVYENSEKKILSVSDTEVMLNLEKLKLDLKINNIKKGNIALFNASNIPKTFSKFKKEFYFSVLADIRLKKIDQLFELIIENKIKSIIFHPYLQKIVWDDWEYCKKFALFAEKNNINIIICTAYGSKEIYNIKVLPFALKIAELVDTPVILSHCGGSKVLEAFLIADKFTNIFMETSFSLNYWIGSSVEQDIAFSIKKLGVERWLFGSDAPFIEIKRAIKEQLNFFDKWKFSEKEIEKIFSLNSRNLFEN